LSQLNYLDLVIGSGARGKSSAAEFAQLLVKYARAFLDRDISQLVKDHCSRSMSPPSSKLHFAQTAPVAEDVRFDNVLTLCEKNAAKFDGYNKTQTETSAKNSKRKASAANDVQDVGGALRKLSELLGKFISVDERGLHRQEVKLSC
jgi:hypothetical protein